MLELELTRYNKIIHKRIDQWRFQYVDYLQIMIDLKFVFLIYTNLLMQHESRKCWDIFKIEIK